MERRASASGQGSAASRLLLWGEGTALGYPGVRIDSFSCVAVLSVDVLMPGEHCCRRRHCW